MSDVDVRWPDLGDIPEHLPVEHTARPIIKHDVTDTMKEGHLDVS